MAMPSLQSHLPQSLASIPSITRHDPVNSRGRKAAPTGGNRSWSEEEENYLLQTRAQKMPYKHIAAYLKKTELACRLHYHQLSHGSHRRKRNNSLSSSSSNGSVRRSPPQYHLNGEPHQTFRTTSLHGHPGFYGAMNPTDPYPNMHNPMAGRAQHKLLLPKPRPLTPEDSPNLVRGLRISTHGSPNNSALDAERIQQMYDTRRGSFWSSMAQDYAQDPSSNHLQDVWRQPQVGQSPSPDDTQNGRAVNIHPMLQPTYPTFQPQYQPAYAQPYNTAVKDFAPMNLPSQGPPAQDKYGYGIPTPQSSYTNTPAMDTLGRTASWSASMQQPVTSINNLLTEDKCPRHTDTRYCAPGRCV